VSRPHGQDEGHPSTHSVRSARPPVVAVPTERTRPRLPSYNYKLLKGGKRIWQRPSERT